MATGKTLKQAAAATLLAMTPVFWAQQPEKPPPQAERGRALFMDSSSQTSCGNCHGIGSYGTKAAPDLKRWAAMAPRAVGTAIRSTITEYVKTVTLKDGQTLPAFIISQDENSIRLYNLMKIPLTPEQVDRAGVESVTDNTTWKHPPSSAPYTTEQLADIIAFIRWAATGNRAPVDPASLEGL